MEYSRDLPTKIKASLFPECFFAGQQWDILKTWQEWKSFHGERCVEIDQNSVSVIDVLVASKLCPSKGTARRAIQDGGISVWFKKISDPKMILHKDSQEALAITLVQKGKHSNRMNDKTAIIYWKDVENSLARPQETATIAP